MKNKSFIKYIVAHLFFGANGVVASYINLNSYEIVFLRTLLGSALLIALFFLSREKISFHKNKKDLMFIGVSGVAMGLSWMFLYEAYSQIGVSIASLCYYCGPVIVMILSPFVFKEKLTKSAVLSFVLVVIGIILVNGGSVEELNHWGVICGFAAAIMYSFMVIFNKKSKNIVGMENSMIQLVISFITVGIFMGFKQGFAMQIDASSILPILILGLLNTGFGCYLYFSSIGKLPVQTVAVFGYLEPVSAVIFSVIILNESISIYQLIGAVLIIGGAITGEYLARNKQK